MTKTNWEFVYQIVHDRIAFNVKNWRFDLEDANPGFSGTWYPAVCPYFRTPAGGDAGYTITEEWWNYLVKMQPKEEKLRQVGGGWINYNKNKNWRAGRVIPANWDGKMPFIEGITAVGNWVLGDSIKNKSLHLVHVPLDSEPDGDFFHNPLRWTKFTSISKKGALGLVGNNIYFPLIAKYDVYIPLTRLEQIPQLPRVETITVKKIDVREYPTSRAAKLGKVKKGADVTLLDYHLWGADVWGQLDGGGWIPLRIVNRALNKYYTTWGMRTEAPLDEYPKPIQPVSDFAEGGEAYTEPEPEIPDVTKQQMMWALLLAAKQVGEDVESWLAITSMSNMLNPASNGSQPYDGAAVEDFPLSEEAIEAILTKLETIGSVSMDPIYSLSNQQVINAVYEAASQLGVAGWDLLLKAEMTDLVGKRLAAYIGPVVADMSALSGAEKQALMVAIDPSLAPEEPEEPEEPEQPSAQPYAGLTNQQMIIAFYRMAEEFETDGWTLIELAGMSSLVEDRNAVYGGPPVEEIGGLSTAQRLVLLEEMLALWGQTQELTYSGLSNQAVVNLFYQAAAGFNESGWSWVEQLGMEYLAVPRVMRALPYRGPKFEQITGLSEERVQALVAALQALYALI